MNKKKPTLISTQQYLIWIILIAVIVRILLMIILQSWEFNGERYGHRAGEIGSALASGQGFSWPEDSTFVPENAIKKTSWEAPIYPLIFAAVFKVFGIYSNTSAVVLILFQILLSGLCCLLIYLIGKGVFSEGVGLIGAFTFALYPAGIHFGIQKIQTTYLIVVLMFIFILQIYGLSKAPTLKKSLLTGVTFGIAILTDPTLIAFFPFALFWLIFKGQGEYRFRMISVVFIFLSVAIINMPWQLRNYNAFGELFFIKSNFSRELFMGNFGSSASIAEERKYMALLNEGQRNSFYTKKALDSIAKNPKRLVRKTIKRIKIYWTASVRKDIHNRAKKINIADRVVRISYLSVIIFGVGGGVLALFKCKKAQLLLWAMVSLPIPYYLTWFARFRYRFPVETIMIVFASYAVYYLWDLLNNGKNYQPE